MYPHFPAHNLNFQNIPLLSNLSAMQQHNNNNNNNAFTTNAMSSTGGAATSAAGKSSSAAANFLFTPYLNNYSELFAPIYSPSETASFDGGAATSAAVHEASSVVEYQQLYNRYTFCLTQLHEYITEVESLSRENESLRVANSDLARRLNLLVSHNYLLSDLNRLNIAATAATSSSGNNGILAATQLTAPQPLKDENRLERRSTERVTIPKSISVRSNGYLKTQPCQNSTRQQSAGQLVPSSQQRVYVPGNKKEADSLEFDVYNQGMQKTELCNKWQETGQCPYGDCCQFAHGIKELRPVIRHPRYKTEVCRMLLAGDTCPYGHRCHFRHSLTEQERMLMAAQPQR